MTPETRNQKTETRNVLNISGSRGFTLLIAIIFMAVMLAFGLALGSIAYKQAVLASSALESQYAFYAADAGLECALYADRKENRFAYTSDFSAPAPVMNCGGAAPFSPPEVTRTQDRQITVSRLSLDGGRYCADVTVYKPASEGITYLFSEGYSVSCEVVEDPPDNARFSTRGIQAHY